MAQLPPHLGWQQFKVLFKQPLMQTHGVNFNFFEKKTGLGISVGDDAKEYFKGICSPLSSPVLAEEVGSVFVIDAAQVKAKQREFNLAFPSVDQSWIFIDALVFSDFLRHEFKRLGIDDNATKNSKSTKIVVQMSHKVIFNTLILSRLLDDTSIPLEISYTVARPRAFLEPGAEFGTVEVTVFVSGQIVLQEEIGLISKEISF
jgi:hypothetical protein